MIYGTEDPLNPDTDDDGRSDKWELDNGTDPLVYDEFEQYAADINKDGAVGAADLLVMASQWLSPPGQYFSGDINEDGIVDLLDFAILAQAW